MSATSLFDPVIDGGVRNPNWFEGRLLTAQSMRERDAAERQRDQLLGRAIGSGVIEGLWVTRGAVQGDGTVRTLSITKGSAITPGGDTLLLGRDVTVDVVPPAANKPVSPALFARCQDPPAIASMPSGFGIYVLVMSLATGYRERAPKSGLGTEGVVTGCGDAFVVEGAQFRLEKLEPQNISVIDSAGRDELTALIANSANPATRSLLRNIVAHHCFGTLELASFPVDPFATSEGVSDFVELGALDDLRKLKRITCCEVPIAVLLWNVNGVDYLDVWSARRTPLPQARSKLWPTPGDEGQLGTAIARFQQFQQHVADLADTTLLANDARAAFRFLPPVGALPFSTTKNAAGFDRTKFFAGCTTRRPAFVNGARITSLIEQSFAYPAIQLPRSTDPPGSELIWNYFVYENGAALDGVLPRTASRGLLIFANGNVPYVANPHFDVARWNYANFALR